MKLLNFVAACVVPLFFVAGCTGTGASDKAEMLRLASTKTPATAVIFWDKILFGGLERIVFSQDDELRGSVSPGQVLTMRIDPGRNEFDMSWEEALDFPRSQTIFIEANDTGPSYFIIQQVDAIFFRSRTLQPVSREVFLKAVQDYDDPGGS